MHRDVFPVVIPTDEPASQTQSAEEEHTQDKRRKREAVGPQPLFPVAAVIVYRTLGQLLPERYDPDRRSLRYNAILPLYLNNDSVSVYVR